MSRRRVVVTGLGMVSPLGNTVADSWHGIVEGKSGVDTIDSFDPSTFNTHFAAAVKNFSVEGYIPAKDARKMDPFIQYGMVAGIQAMRDSGLDITEANANRAGISVGSGIGGLGSIEDVTLTLEHKGPRRISPFFVPGAIINMIAGGLSMHYGMKGPNIASSTACTSGTHSIGLAARMIMYGDADVMLAGGAEMPITPVGIGGFGAARALSTRNDNPQAASRPWDKDRDGFVLGDGAGVMVLEEYQQAKARGAHIYAELVGFGMSGDAYHMTSPPEDGAGAALAMRNALMDAAVDPSDIDYINAHGTSTNAGDRAECRAVKAVLGSAVDKVAVSSTKSMIGHLLGGAGAVEAIFTVLSIRDSVAPPTINLDNIDPDCAGVNLVPHTAQERPITAAMSNSFGFGGTNGTLLFRKLR